MLASVTVHDLPPTAGYLRDEHVRIRAELGLLTTPEETERAHADRERQAWAEVLRRMAGWAGTSTSAPTQGWRSWSWRCTGPSRRLRPASSAVSLPDIVGDRRAQNQPGTDQEYPNWRVPLTDGAGRPVTLEQVMQGSELGDRLIGTVR